jgi:TolB-like protein
MKIGSFLLFLLLLFPFYLFGEVTNTMAIAVLDFKNLSPNKGYDFLEKTIAESFTTTLQKSGRFKLAERQRLQDIMEEKKLALSGLVDNDIDNGRKIAALISADSLILGSYSSIDDRIEVNVRLVKADSGEILMADKISEKMGDKLFLRINELADAVVNKLLEYKTGFLNLDTSPQAADVKIEDAFIGTTPITQKKMKTGKYSATIVKDGYEIKTLPLNIEEGKSANYNVYLEKKTEQLYKYHFSIISHMFKLIRPDYQMDWGLAFESMLGDFSLGVEGGGNIFFHQTTDNSAPGKPFVDNLVLYYHRFNGILKYNLFQDSKVISPYIGVGLGVIAAGDFKTARFYYKGILGLTMFPTSPVSFFVEMYYHDLGQLVIQEKKFNLFGSYTTSPLTVEMSDLMVGLGIRFNF